MEGEHLVVSCTLSVNGHTIATHALIDSGATGIAFIDENFARHHQLPLVPLPNPRSLEVIDGHPISSGDITHTTTVKLSINEHQEELPMFVTQLGHYPIVLGIPWMDLHDINIRFHSRTVTFGSQYCSTHCTPFPTVAHGVAPEKLSNPAGVCSSSGTVSLVSNVAQTCEPAVSAGAGDIEAQIFTSHSNFDKMKVDNHQAKSDTKPIQIAALGGHSFRRVAHKQKLTVFSISLHEINLALQPEEKPKKKLVLEKYVPKEFDDFLPLFSEALAKNLPPHRSYDQKILLHEGFTPPFRPVYPLSKTELETLMEWLEKNLSKGFIRASSSPAASPILFVKKNDGTLRLCVDYRGLNEGTIKNRYPLTLVQETLMRLSKAKYFTCLYIHGAYNLVRIAEGEEWKTAFRTRYGLYESLVMPFRLTNAPADFQALINDVLRAYLDDFCTAYIDDIMIYSNTLKERKEQVYKVLKALSDAGLHLKPEKCQFHKQEVKYLGFIIGTNGIRMDPEKISCILDWQTPKNVTEVQCFLGFANFYRRFIKDYSKAVTPLTSLTKKEGGKYIPFMWSSDQQAVFDQLKNAFTMASILRHFD